MLCCCCEARLPLQQLLHIMLAQDKAKSTGAAESQPHSLLTLLHVRLGVHPHGLGLSSNLLCHHSSLGSSGGLRSSLLARPRMDLHGRKGASTWHMAWPLVLVLASTATTVSTLLCWRATAGGKAVVPGSTWPLVGPVATSAVTFSGWATCAQLQ